jgi:AcrR family transcriptional regulator
LPRPASIEEDELIARLSRVFQDVGYEGASLAMLSAASGLQRASLYHRFPGGKQQMAEEVLNAAIKWTIANVIAPLKREGELGKRLAEARANLKELYGAGSKSCLLNMLMAPRNMDGPFAPAIKAAFEALIEAFAHFAREAGVREARKAGQRAVTLIQGSLVLSRGLQDPKPFRDALSALESELLPKTA